MTNFELKKVNTKFEWRAYHRIRRKELFDNSRHYDENHPDEFKAENEPMLMFMEVLALLAARP